MDELEISGKRYISTRRAAKEYKYSSDYIGQLLRAKKVIGKKVGRSWYAEADSLGEYLNSEIAPDVKKEEVKEEADSLRELDQNQEKEEAVVPKKEIRHVHFEAVPREETTEERSYRIPINMKPKKGLVYLTDDEPLLPRIERSNPYRYGEITVDGGREESAPASVPIKKQGSNMIKIILAVCVGLLVLGGVAGASIMLSSTVVADGVGTSALDENSK